LKPDDDDGVDGEACEGKKRRWMFFRRVDQLRRVFSMADSLFTTGPYAGETRVALAAVRKAAQVTSVVFNTLVKDRTDTAVKDDKSPVTGAACLLILF
jgi:hypothetical protein